MACIRGLRVTYCQRDPQEYISVKIQAFSFKKLHMKLSSAKWQPFCSGLNVLSHCGLVMSYGMWDLGQNGHYRVWCWGQLDPLSTPLNTLRPRQNGRHFPDDTFERIFLNDNVRILIKISLKFVPKGPIINIPSLVQIIAWRRPGDKPLSEPMMVSLLTHICVTWPQWVNPLYSLMGAGWADPH